MNGNGTFDALRATREERLDLCAYLDTPASEQWRAPSLCPGWTDRDVVAHLTTSTTITLRHVLVGMIRRGDFDRMEMERAVAISRRFTPDDLVRQIRETAGSASRAPGSSRLDPLLDVLVHGQDIARPSGRQRPMRSEWRCPPWPTRSRVVSTAPGSWFGRMRLEVTDASWTFGEGTLRVAGPVADLMLVATGRQAGIAALDGSSGGHADGAAGSRIERRYDTAAFPPSTVSVFPLASGLTIPHLAHALWTSASVGSSS